MHKSFMAKDLLEQITEDYFRELGYFTRSNSLYRPDNIGVHSDIDVLAVHPITNEVAVVSCKSWSNGININEMLKTLKSDNPSKVIRGGTYVKRFREIADKKWSNALKKEIYRLTGKHTFTFYVSVAHYKGNKDEFESLTLFKENLPNCEIKIITFKEIIQFLDKGKTDTPSQSELVRTLQLLKVSGGVINFKETI
jgi:hypothetical protein